MVGISVMAYLSTWVFTSLAVFAAAKYLADRRSPAPHPVALSVMAGAIWPLLLVGLVEMSSVVVYTKAYSRPVPRVSTFA